VTPPAVSLWLKKNRAPSQRCIAIEEFTKGLVTRYQLRPDVFGPAPQRKRPGY
jgi:DNA-binding transcriptional regulator YdaS (Cro superfamily)